MNEEDKLDNAEDDSIDVKEEEDIAGKSFDSKLNEAPKQENTTPEVDLDKVKVSEVLSHKMKKNNSKLKKVIAYVLVGLVCFCAGFATDRAFTGRRNREFFGRPQMGGNAPGNFNRNRRNNQNTDNNQSQNQNNIPTPSNGQPQN